MTHTQCNAHLTGSFHMANSTTKTDKYIKTFDAADDPIVYVLVRTSPYTFDDMLIGVFDSIESVLLRLKRIMDRPENDETFKIETHNLRNLQLEQALDK
jgi:hypothetical protein